MELAYIEIKIRKNPIFNLKNSSFVSIVDEYTIEQSWVVSIE